MTHFMMHKFANTSKIEISMAVRRWSKIRDKLENDYLAENVRRNED